MQALAETTEFDGLNHWLGMRLVEGYDPPELIAEDYRRALPLCSSHTDIRQRTHEVDPRHTLRTISLDGERLRHYPQGVLFYWKLWSQSRGGIGGSVVIRRRMVKGRLLYAVFY
jgi:hypothetical protein